MQSTNQILAAAGARCFVDTGLTQKVHGHEIHILLCCERGENRNPKLAFDASPNTEHPDGLTCEHCSGSDEVRHRVLSFAEGFSAGWLDSNAGFNSPLITITARELMGNAFTALADAVDEAESRPVVPRGRRSGSGSSATDKRAQVGHVEN